MPYILKEDRPPYDKIINTLVMSDEADRSLDTSIPFKQESLDQARAELKAHFRRIDLKAIDGHLNYFLTKLMKRLRWTVPSVSYFGTIGSPVYNQLKEMVLDVIKMIYPPKYFNYNRAIGVFSCCEYEFHRRYGRSMGTIPAYFLQDLAYTFYATNIAPYEDTKIVANGDV